MSKIRGRTVFFFFFVVVVVVVVVAISVKYRSLRF